MSEGKGVDLLAEWIELSREVMGRYWPDADYVVLVGDRGSGKPAVHLVVTPRASSSDSPPPPAGRS